MKIIIFSNKYAKFVLFVCFWSKNDFSKVYINFLVYKIIKHENYMTMGDRERKITNDGKTVWAHKRQGIRQKKI